MSALSLTTQTADFRTLRSNISAKTKNFAKPFLPVQLGLRSNILSQKGQKSRDTVPLNPTPHFFVFPLSKFFFLVKFS